MLKVLDDLQTSHCTLALVQRCGNGQYRIFYKIDERIWRREEAFRALES